MTYPYVGIDAETTGFSNKDEIIEVYAIEFDLDGNTGESFHQLCYPKSGKISEDATTVHRITIDQLKGKPVYADIKDSLDKFISDRPIVAHNVSFEKRFLKIEDIETECTLKLCRKLNEDGGGNSLAESCKRYGIEFDKSKAHRAEYDTMKCIELFCALDNEY